jgi:hypothetical protein
MISDNCIVPSIDEASCLSAGDLEKYDIVALNLCAANGLPGTDALDVESYRDKLDDWAEHVALEVWRHVYRFNPRSIEPPSEFYYGNSLGRFICWYMLQVLQEDCGVVYNPTKKFDPDFCDPQDLFVHGILDDDGLGGTCASMPIVYVSVARRLGLPVFLVEGRGHLFFRWEDAKGTLIRWPGMDESLWIPPDRFNVEGAGEGIAFYPDSHYVQWPQLWKESDFEHGRYLVSLSADEEFASFLVQRSECFHELGNLTESLKALYYARQLCPDDLRYESLHAKRTWKADQLAHRLLELGETSRQQRPETETPGGHPPHCACVRCQAARAAAAIPVPPHGAACQCLACRQAHEAAAVASVTIPGHSVNCCCSGCLSLRVGQVAATLQPQVLGFPTTAVPLQSISDKSPTVRLPNTVHGHFSHSARPQLLRLPPGEFQ